MCHTSNTCRVPSCCELIKPTISVYIVREQLICHQPVMRMLAHSEDFPIHVVHALFHTQAFFKFNRAVPYITYSCYVHSLVVNVTPNNILYCKLSSALVES